MLPALQIHSFPNATVAEYGTYSNDLHAIMAEIYARGPVKASINGMAIANYTGGIIYDDPSLRNMTHNHGVSIVGWGLEESTSTTYWIVRNSWVSDAHLCDRNLSDRACTNDMYGPDRRVNIGEKWVSSVSSWERTFLGLKIILRGPHLAHSRLRIILAGKMEGTAVPNSTFF